MAIPLRRESDEEIREAMGIIEGCHFCDKRTRHWHHNTNNPVCEDCAKIHKVAELPDYGKMVRKLDREERNRVESPETTFALVQARWLEELRGFFIRSPLS